MSNWSPEQIKQIVDSNKIVVFAKGTRHQPMCGFSARAIQILEQLGKPFEVVNIFEDASIRPSLVEAYGWPTTPQVFVSGELLGGSDIALQMYESGELQKKVDAAFANA
jgi:monothiol glutaredoxin